MNEPEHRQLSRAELAQLEARFRNRRRSTPEQSSQAVNRRWRNRIIRWSALLCVAVMLALWVFGERLRLGWSSESPVVNDKRPLERVPILADRARLPNGCVEVTDAVFPSLNGLAEGSPNAVDTQRLTASDYRLPIEIVNSIGMHFRLIPAGTFVMGSPENEVGRGPDETEHVVAISAPFYMGMYEVTQGEYERVMGTNPAAFKHKGHRAPVEEVTWRMCTAFTKKLCVLEGVAPGTYRLPREHEWEYACRAGTQTPFHCGRTRDALAAFAEFRWNNDTGPQPVGGRRPNAWGLFNMHGNVWEWCENRFYFYETTSVDPLNRSIRGGNWRTSALDSRSASRYRLPPDSLGNICGFRIMRVLTSAELAAGRERTAAPPAKLGPEGAP